jgi:hypothetical protein
MITKQKLKSHSHFWILDRNSFGVCKCGDERQFPVEEIPRLGRNDIQTLKGVARLALHSPDSWISGRLVD